MMNDIQFELALVSDILHCAARCWRTRKQRNRCGSAEKYYKNGSYESSVRYIQRYDDDALLLVNRALAHPFYADYRTIIHDAYRMGNKRIKINRCYHQKQFGRRMYEHDLNRAKIAFLKRLQRISGDTQFERYFLMPFTSTKD